MCVGAKLQGESKYQGPEFGMCLEHGSGWGVGGGGRSEKGRVTLGVMLVEGFGF